MLIRKENASDHEAVDAVHRAAFADQTPVPNRSRSVSSATFGTTSAGSRHCRSSPKAMPAR